MKSEPIESFVFYRSFFDAMDGFSVEQRERIFTAICKYAIYGEEIELSGIEKAIFTVVKPSLDSNRKKYEDGKKGGRPRKNNHSKEQQETTDNDIEKPKSKNKKTSGFQKGETSGYADNENTVYVTDTVTAAVSENETVPVSENDAHFPGAQTGKVSRNSMKIPTLDDVIEYAETRGRVDLAKTFFNYYNVADWRDSTGAKVRNWKQKFITWEQKNPKPVPRNDQPQKTADGRTRYIDFNDDSLFLN